MDVAASFGGGGIGRSADCTYVEDVEIANITARQPPMWCRWLETHEPIIPAMKNPWFHEYKREV